MKKIAILCLVVFVSMFGTTAQNVAIGEWKSHLPYNGAAFVADAGAKVYCANGNAVFSYSKTDQSYDRLSTAAGFSDIGIKNLNYGAEKNVLVIGYTNSNIDFLFGTEIYNFPFIKESNINGDKNIYNAAFLGDTVILSCGFGIVLFDIQKRESPATFFFTSADASNMRVNASVVSDGYIYAGTANGVFKGSLSEPNLQDFSKWELSNDASLPIGDTRYISAFNGELYASIGDTIYKHDGTGWQNWFFEAGWTTNQMRTDRKSVV